MRTNSLLIAALAVSACTGSTGPTGPEGPVGPPGASPDAAPPPPVIGSVAALYLPDSAPYPTSIGAAADGTLFVGTLLGPIVKFVPTSIHAEPVVAQVGAAGTIVANILVDPATSTLYACGDLFHGTSQNPFASPSATLYAYDLAGTLKASYALPQQGSSLCEDIAIGSDGSVYITDPFVGAVDRIAAPVTASSTVTTWATSSLFAANTANRVPPFGAHGIAVVGSDVYVSNFSSSALVRVPIASDGSADAAQIRQEQVAITNPEHLVALDATHLLVSEDVWCGPGRLSQLERSADNADTWTVQPLKNNLLGATGFAMANASYYTVESQVCGLVTQLAGGPAANPIVPFWIDRIDAN